MWYILKQFGEISTSIHLHFEDYFLIIAAMFKEYCSFKFSLNSNLKYLFNTTLSSLKTYQFQPKTDPHSGDHDETKQTNKQTPTTSHTRTLLCCVFLCPSWFLCQRGGRTGDGWPVTNRQIDQVCNTFLCGKRHGESKVICPNPQYNSARARTQTSPAEVQRANHEATTSPRSPIYQASHLM